MSTGKPARLLATSLGRRLASGAATAFALKLMGTGLAFLLQLLLARAFDDKASFGTYAVALAWANMLVLLGKRGMDSAALRFLPEYRSHARPNARAGFLVASRSQVLRSSTLVGTLGCLGVLTLSPYLAEGQRTAFLVAFACVPLLSLLQLFAGFLQAEKRILASQGPLLCLVPGFAILGALFVFGLLGAPATPARGLLIYGGGAALALGISAFLFQDSAGEGSPDADATDRAWRSVGNSMLLTSGFGLILAQADLLMLGPLAGYDAAGEYAAVTRLARFLSFPLLAANAIVAPLISELYHAGRKAELQRLLEHAVQGVLLVSSPILLLLALQAESILGLFGEQFVTGAPALLILLVGHTVNVLVGSVGYLLNMTGGHRTAARILGISAAVNVALNAVLIPALGTQGAALATATTTVVWNVSMYVVVRRRTGIRPSFF